MGMIDFKIDTSKCIRCKKCVTDCPVLIIDGKTDYPEIKEGKADNCLKCQHCLAVCPEGALSIWGYSPEDSILSSEPTADPVQLTNLIKLRRSVRRFKKTELDPSLINLIANNALYAPTAKNENSVRFSIIDNREDMNSLREAVYQCITKATSNGQIKDSLSFFSNFADVWNSKKIDVIFRNAPHLVIASAPKDASLPVVDSSIALSYFELLANAHGIGTLWDGFALQALREIAHELKGLLGIAENHEITMVMVFGLSAVKYPRSIQSEHPEVHRIRLSDSSVN